MQYKGVLWDGRQGVRLLVQAAASSPRSSSAQVVKGWAQGLTGKKVGSRVLIVIPPELGYGDKPAAGQRHQEDSTLVFSVDILAKM